MISRFVSSPRAECFVCIRRGEQTFVVAARQAVQTAAEAEKWLKIGKYAFE